MQKLNARDSNHYYDGAVPDTDTIDRAATILKRFPLRSTLSTRAYSPRLQQRYLLLKDRFSAEVRGRVLDMGSRNDTFFRIFGIRSQQIDKNNPDIPSFDWEIDSLPFTDKSIDTVLCLDTLEHINRIHYAFDDLLRVSNGAVLISLPNCWRKAARDIVWGSGTTASYGLQLELPKDRHHWYFNTEDAVSFLTYRALKHANTHTLSALVYHAPATRMWHRILYPILTALLPRHMKNVFVETVFVLFTKV